MRAFFTIIFILALAAWLRAELDSKASLTKHWRWIAAAAALQISGQLISNALNGPFIGNILLHAIGGGMASTCLFIYLIRTFKVKVNWRLELVMLFLLVAAFGTINELGEFALELLNLGTYSFDTHDTWRDLASNTSGALLAWGLVRSFLVFSRR